MNSMKLFSVTISLAFVGLMIAPTSDAFYLFHPIHVFHAAKVATVAVIGKGAALAAVAVPVVAKGAILGKAAVVGGVAGGKTGLLAASAKAPLFLAKSALPNLLSLAPLLKTKGKKSTSTVARAAPLPPPPAPVLSAPVYAPSYQQQAPLRNGY